ncbi:MAG: delta-60 repeat domain-containing protein [Flavobacteriales bacterium]|nr:delta-60 repeat domain-containing protein [Flavobacteriales bacterium]
MFRTLTLGPAVLFCAVIAAQPGSIDHSFNATDIGFGHGDGARLAVHATVLQPDGKILIAGKFTTYNGTARNRIARLNVDGSLDTTFDPGTGSSGTVYCLAMQPDGKVLIGGYFSSYNGTLRNNIARINNDGSLDTTFDPGSGPNEVVRSITVQPDGKILIGGVFTSYDGTPTNYITRVNADGSLDTSFNIGTGADILITSIVLQPDGKILVGGWFNSFNGSPIDFFARLNADGTLDAGFDPGTGPSSTIWSIAVQADGRIVIVGDYANYNGVGRNRIARVNADGSLDTSFDPGAGANNDVETVALQADGKVLIGGWFTDYNGVGPDRLARLEADGDMDASFNPGAGPNATVWSIVVQPDGKSLVGDDFSYDNLTGHNHVSRRNIDGSIDLSFNPGTGTNGSVYSFAVQPDGKILIAGDFTSFNGVARIRVARLHADGIAGCLFRPG